MLNVIMLKVVMLIVYCV